MLLTILGACSPGSQEATQHNPSPGLSALSPVSHTLALIFSRIRMTGLMRAFVCIGTDADPLSRGNGCGRSAAGPGEGSIRGASSSPTASPTTQASLMGLYAKKPDTRDRRTEPRPSETSQPHASSSSEKQGEAQDTASFPKPTWPEV